MQVTPKHFTHPESPKAFLKYIQKEVEVLILMKIAGWKRRIQDLKTCLQVMEYPDMYSSKYKHTWTWNPKDPYELNNTYHPKN